MGLELFPKAIDVEFEKNTRSNPEDTSFLTHAPAQ